MRDYLSRLRARLIALRDAIYTAHAGKYKPLNVRRSGKLCVWDPSADIGWLEYQKAMREICKYPRLRRLLVKLNII